MGVTIALISSDEMFELGRIFKWTETTSSCFGFGLHFQPNSSYIILYKQYWEILVAGSEQGIEAGQVGLRLIT